MSGGLLAGITEMATVTQEIMDLTGCTREEAYKQYNEGKRLAAIEFAQSEDHWNSSIEFCASTGLMTFPEHPETMH